MIVYTRMILEKYYKKVQNIGVHPDLEPSEARSVKTHNGLLFASAILMLPFPLVFVYIDEFQGLYLCAYAVFIITYPFVLNYIRKYFIARFTAILASLSVFILGIYMFGFDAGFEYGIMSSMILPILYFKESRIRTILYIFYFFLLLFSYLILLQVNIEPLAPDARFILKTSLFIGCLILVIFYFFSTDLLYRESEEKNEELVSSLLIKNRELKQFSHSVSHDLKEPLRTISSFTQLLKREMGPHFTAKAHDYHNFITLGTKQMNTLLDDVLRYSKIGSSDAELVDVDLNKTISDVLGQLTFSLEKTKREINLEKLPLIKGTETLLHQLFLNLISNAIKFNKKDQPFKLEVWSETDTLFHNVYVKDFGIGIEKEFQENVFEIFKRLHPRYEYEGSGIGLATCQRIMEKLNGKIRLESELDKGTTFIISFPK